MVMLCAGVGVVPAGSSAAGEGRERPYFDDVSPRNVSAVVGQSAVLRCRAKHIGNRTVSIVNNSSCLRKSTNQCRERIVV